MDKLEHQNDPAAKPQGDGRITAVEPENFGTVEHAAVYVDGRLAVRALAKDVRGLAAGEKIMAGQLERLRKRYERSAYLQAVRFLGRRDRSVREVQRHLHAKGWDDSAGARVVDKLKREGLLGDEELARKWIAYRGRTAPRSRRAIIQELQQRGVAPEIIHEAVAAMDERALALACARKKQRQWRRYPVDERLRRVMAFLQRKGFPHAVCRETARILIDDAPQD